MMKNVKKAAPEFATAETFVWWDMDSCPVPNGYDPSRVGPRIDTELKNLGYNGPLTIIGIGNLEGVPHEFLKALSSGGVVIKQLSLGSHMIKDVIDAMYSDERRFQPPLSMMIITAAHADVLEEVVCDIYNRGSSYNLLLAYPEVTEHADPEPPSLLVDNFGGEWVWDRFGLLKDQGSANNDTRRQDTGCESHFCGLCKYSFPIFDDFATHLDSPRHARNMDEYLSYLAERFHREAENFEVFKLQELYLAKVNAKRLEFKKIANYFKDDSDSDSEYDTPNTTNEKKKQSKSIFKKPKLLRSMSKKLKAPLLCRSTSLKKKPTTTLKKLSKSKKKLEIAEEAECSLPKNATT